MDQDFTAEEIKSAQEVLDTHHPRSPFWDSLAAEDAMEVIEVAKLTRTPGAQYQRFNPAINGDEDEPTDYGYVNADREERYRGGP